MSIDNIVKDFILKEKTIATIITDFKALFMEFSSYPDTVLEVYIDTAFYIVPAWFTNIGFSTIYKVYLYSLAHLLANLGVQIDGSTSQSDNRLAHSLSINDISISYKEIGTVGTLSEWEYFFGTTNYGRIVLMFLKVNGFEASKGVFIV